jgi:hypothetical protein
MPVFETNTPLLINTNDITNPYHGYQDQEEVQNYLLLENYIKSSCPARGILLKHMFKNLNEIIQNRSFVFEGEAISFSKEDLPVLQSIFQIDIIAKIMMYVEDLIIILEAILKAGGDYYGLLDIDITKDRDVDVGDRIKKFFQDKDNFSMMDWRKKLSYLNPNNETKYSNVIAKLIELNIVAFRDFINNIQIFSETHHRIFRRYKHAGFPFKPGYRSELPYPFTSRRFDSYSMVFVGKTPLADLIPLPYADDVIESYRILVPTLQRMIRELVQNKIACIRRRVDGVMPSVSYSPPGTFTPEENSEIELAIIEYNEQYPNRAYSDIYDFPICEGTVKNMRWYIDLAKNMKKWKEMKDIEDRSL